MPTYTSVPVATLAAECGLGTPGDSPVQRALAKVQWDEPCDILFRNPDVAATAHPDIDSVVAILAATGIPGLSFDEETKIKLRKLMYLCYTGREAAALTKVKEATSPDSKSDKVCAEKEVREQLIGLESSSKVRILPSHHFGFNVLATMLMALQATNTIPEKVAALASGSASKSSAEQRGSIGDGIEVVISADEEVELSGIPAVLVQAHLFTTSLAIVVFSETSAPAGNCIHGRVKTKGREMFPHFTINDADQLFIQAPQAFQGMCAHGMKIETPPLTKISAVLSAKTIALGFADFIRGVSDTSARNNTNLSTGFQKMADTTTIATLGATRAIQRGPFTVAPNQISKPKANSPTSPKTSTSACTLPRHPTPAPTGLRATSSTTRESAHEASASMPPSMTPSVAAAVDTTALSIAISRPRAQNNSEILGGRVGISNDLTDSAADVTVARAERNEAHGKVSATASARLPKSE